MNAMFPAPVALFVYKRTGHTRQALEALAKCPEFSESELFVFSDGPKLASDQRAVEQVRELIRSIHHPKVNIVTSEQNRGLANSITKGVTEICLKYGHVIVIEDDLVVSPLFLTYMNAGLHRYQSEERVMQISGHVWQPLASFKDNECVFLPFITSWGWATWQRSWRNFDPAASGATAMLQDRSQRRKFNSPGLFDWATMLEDQMKGSIDSWAIRWYWSVFKAGGLALHPPGTFVRNLGLDGTGTHSTFRAQYFFRTFDEMHTKLPKFPNVVAQSPAVMEQLSYLYQCSWRGRAFQLARASYRKARTVSRVLWG
jgi:hypothetical protein